MLPDDLYALEVLLAEFPGLKVAHGYPLGAHISLLLQVIELVPRYFELTDDLRCLHTVSPCALSSCLIKTRSNPALSLFFYSSLVLNKHGPAHLSRKNLFFKKIRACGNT